MSREVAVDHVRRFGTPTDLATVQISADHIAASIGCNSHITLYFDNIGAVRAFADQLVTLAREAEEAPPIDAPEEVADDDV